MLKGKTAIVTGSTTGIGLGIARGLASQGAQIVLNGFVEAATIERTIAELRAEFGTEVIYHGADMSKPVQIEGLVATTLEKFGRIDVLVNNAGIQHVAPIEEFPPAKWDAIIAINLSSAFHLTRLAIPVMKRNGWGRVVNIASAHGLVASPFKSAYVAAKHGIVGLTKTVALEVATEGITANAVCPGYVRTPLVEAQIPDQARARGISEEAVVRDVLLAAQPTKRFVTVEELAGVVNFLCSDAAASITGSAIPVEGGWTAH
jgi:3-hydroxybutyrate dehydrogenase